MWCCGLLVVCRRSTALARQSLPAALCLCPSLTRPAPSRPGVRTASREGGDTSLMTALTSAATLTATQQDTDACTDDIRARLNAGVATLRRLAALCEAHAHGHAHGHVKHVKTHEAREAREAREADDEHSETSERRAAPPLAGVDAGDTELDTSTNHAIWLRAAETRLWGTPSLARHW